MSSRHPRLLVLALVAVAAVPITVAEAVVVGERTTTIISPPPEGGSSDGPSDNVTFSQDNRETRLVAFDSAATNIVPGDTNGRRDVFLKRREVPGANGNFNGTLSRISAGRGGAPANGDSQKPAIDGDNKRAPHCVVYESTATNLASGDRTPDSDIFLYDTRRRRTTLVSVGVRNAVDAIVDGECESVTFSDGRSVYVRALKLRKTVRIARGANPDQATNGKGVAYERGGQVYYQGFQEKFRSRRKGGPIVRRVGREVLVSRNASGPRGNGASRNASVDDNGFYVAFESTATNLCEAGQGCPGLGQADRNGAVSDIFRRNLNPRRAPTNEFMAMVSYSQGCTRGNENAAAVDAQGDGPSNNPAMTGAGENVVFDSEATNLRESAGILVADGNGPIRDIYYWNFPRDRKCGNVSRESRNEDTRESGTGQPYNGPSVKPAASSRANFIGFTSSQSGDSGETNGPEIPDVFARFLGGGPEG